MDLARRMSDCSSASFSRMCNAYDSDPGLGGLDMMPNATCPVTFGDRLMEQSLYISSETLRVFSARRDRERERRRESTRRP